MHVHLTPEMEELVRNKISSGEYSSASDVVCEGLRLLGERDQLFQLQKDEIAQKISEGLESLRTGKGLDGEEVFDRIESELDQLDSTGSK
jgi:antitoxin ParD1/3/4